MPDISFSREPALYIAAANALIFLAVSFGLPITNDQKAAIDGVIGAVLAVAAGIVIRSQVTPVASSAPAGVVIAVPETTPPIPAPPHG